MPNLAHMAVFKLAEFKYFLTNMVYDQYLLIVDIVNKE